MNSLFNFDLSLVRIVQEPIKDKNTVLQMIAETAKREPALNSFSEKEILKALKERESAGTTAFGKGIAIPHCRLKGLDKFVIGAIIVNNGAPFESMDKQPVRIFIFIIGPESDRTRHIRILSIVSKVLMNEDTMKNLLESKTASDFVSRFKSYIPSDEGSEQKEYRLMHIIINHEEWFDQVLQEISLVAKGNIVVLESESASTYFHAMPLFSSYWSEGGRGFSRTILVVLNMEMVNEAARRVSLIAGDLNQASGILVFTQPINLLLGSIDY